MEAMQAQMRIVATREPVERMYLTCDSTKRWRHVGHRTWVAMSSIAGATINDVRAAPAHASWSSNMAPHRGHCTVDT